MAGGQQLIFWHINKEMVKVKQVRIGKVVKKKDPMYDDKFTLTLKQHGKLSGADSRALKALIEGVCEKFLSEKYDPPAET